MLDAVELAPEHAVARELRGEAADGAADAGVAAHPAAQPVGFKVPHGTRSRRADGRSPHRLQFVDEALDDVEAASPEARVRGVEAERRQQLLVAPRAAGAEHVEILRREAAFGLAIDRIERVHQTVAE